MKEKLNFQTVFNVVISLAFIALCHNMIRQDKHIIQQYKCILQLQKTVLSQQKLLMKYKE